MIQIDSHWLAIKLGRQSSKDIAACPIVIVIRKIWMQRGQASHTLQVGQALGHRDPGYWNNRWHPSDPGQGEEVPFEQEDCHVLPWGTSSLLWFSCPWRSSSSKRLPHHSMEFLFIWKIAMLFCRDLLQCRDSLDQKDYIHRDDSHPFYFYQCWVPISQKI